MHPVVGARVLMTTSGGASVYKALPQSEASIKLLYHFFVGFCCVVVGVGFLLVCALGVGVEVPAGGGVGGERLGVGFLKLFRGFQWREGA